MKIFVAGASGFVGGAIARRFLQDGHEVWGGYHGQPTHVPDGCRPAPLSDIKKLKDTFDCVIIAAGNHSLPPTELIEANVSLTRQLTQQLPGARMVYVSSVATFGTHTDVMNEESSFNQPTFYGLAKLAGEAVTRAHPNHAILRLTYLYGKGMPTNSFLPAIIQKARTEKLITLFGKGERLQDYLHIDDVTELCVKAAQATESNIYLGATGHSLSNTQVAKEIMKHVPGCKLTYSGEDNAMWFRFDPSATQAALGWRPNRKFGEALAEMVAA